MRDVETYLDRADEALRLLDLAEGREAKLAIVAIVRTWVQTAERRAQRNGLSGPELTATFAAMQRNVDTASSNLGD